MIEGSWLPITERERELMEDIFIATREAYNDGVEKWRIAALLAFMASSTLDPRSSEKQSTSVEQSLEEALNDKPEICPIEGCEQEITGVSSQWGGPVVIHPCGHEIEWDEKEELGDWIDEL